MLNALCSLRLQAFLSFPVLSASAGAAFLILDTRFEVLSLWPRPIRDNSAGNASHPSLDRQDLGTWKSHPCLPFPCFQPEIWDGISFVGVFLSRVLFEMWPNPVAHNWLARKFSLLLPVLWCGKLWYSVGFSSCSFRTFLAISLIYSLKSLCKSSFFLHNTMAFILVLKHDALVLSQCVKWTNVTLICEYRNIQPLLMLPCSPCEDSRILPRDHRYSCSYKHFQCLQWSRTFSRHQIPFFHLSLIHDLIWSSNMSSKLEAFVHQAATKSVRPRHHLILCTTSVPNWNWSVSPFLQSVFHTDFGP